MTDVQGRTAFITGGANGIGLGIARSLARAGARLAIADIDAGALQRAKAELEKLTQVETYQLDVRDREAYAETAKAVESALGPVSLLFNNAGIAGAVPVKKFTYDLWDWSIGINLYGVINGIQTFLPGMVERGEGGHIVNTASGAGLVGGGAGTMYHTAKFGVVGLSESLNPELAPAGIGVTVLCPGPVATDILERSAEATPKDGMQLSENQVAQGAEKRAKMTAILKQQGVSPDDVGEMVLKAVRENSMYIHTDRIMEEPLKMRHKMLLDAMPA